MGNCLSYRLKLIPPNDMSVIIPYNLTCFSLKSLKKATDNFATVVRRNGFSKSYVGTLADGSRVVVKVYDNTRLLDIEFNLMIEIMSSVKHQNLVELIGYCNELGQKMLVHDFLGDYSLNQYLFPDSKVEGADLDWPQRVSICHGIARAIDYLHNGASPCVVLRDVKPGNVYVDSSSNPKIVDFEIASFLQEGESHRSGPMFGTIGYIDPEYLVTGMFSAKTDIHAFGITLLEIVSGRHNIQLPRDHDSLERRSLTDWAWELLESGTIPEIVDPTIFEFLEEEVIRLVSVALSCGQVSELRPSITEVRLMLSDGYDLSNLALTRPTVDMATPSHSQRCSNDVLPRTPNLPQNVICFSFQSLENATNHFSSRVRSNGFSSSYKGTLDDGSKVVVKVYDTYANIDFTSVIEIMSGLKHQNVVELIGYCLEDNHQILVHDFLGDYSLDQYLFPDSKVEGADLDWPQRVSICHGIARALDYLHNGASPCVVLRDLKPGNIFVDSNFNPKIVDFALAHLIEEGESDWSGPISGTLGYMDSDYYCIGRFSEKIDIYAFGITLLEIVSGRSIIKFLRDHENLERRSLTDWAWELLESGRIPEIVDPTIFEFLEEEVIRLVIVALSCVQNSELRPNITEVRIMLLDSYGLSNLALTRPTVDMATPSHSQRISNDVLPRTPNLPQNVICFSLQSLENATNHFSSRVRSNGFSSSYNGTLDDGSKVVVKVYDTATNIDFISMIEIMSSLKHQNVVELIGYCLEDNLQILVHEFIGDYSLDQFLFTDSKVEEVELNWGKRVSICHGIACSLDYLHSEVSPCVVLRDVKPGNVFVDSSFNPKIVDFEVACLHDEGESDQSGPLAGIIGYLDPEYFRTRKTLKKTDIYAFGITLLEIISGKKNVQFSQDHEGTSLVDWAWEIRETGGISEIVDPSLSEFSEYEVSNFVSVALSCVQLPSELRPSMSEVRLMLSVGYEFSNMVLTRPRATQQCSDDQTLDNPPESSRV